MPSATARASVAGQERRLVPAGPSSGATSPPPWWAPGPVTRWPPSDAPTARSCGSGCGREQLGHLVDDCSQAGDGATQVLELLEEVEGGGPVDTVG